MTKKKVAFFVSSLDSGGVENYLLRFLTFYKDQIEAVVYCKLGYTGELLKKFLDLGVSVIPFHIGYFNLLNWIRLYHNFRLEQFNSVCDFTGNFAGIPLGIAKKAGIEKRIAFYRGSTNHFKEDKLRLLYNDSMNKIVKKCATHVLSNSQSALDYFFPDRNKNDNFYQVIYNGIDSKQFCNENRNLRYQLAIPDNAFVVGHVGRYNIAKNHETILKVAIKLCHSSSNIFFIFCGKGVKQNLLPAVLSEGLENQIKFLDYRSDVNRVLNTFNLFYFPSLTEGQPNALIEAMVIGLPFIASNIQPILETVPNELSTQLVDPKDVDEAIRKIISVQENTDISKLTCAEWARRKFSPDLWFNLFMEKL